MIEKILCSTNTVVNKFLNLFTYLSLFKTNFYIKNFWQSFLVVLQTFFFCLFFVLFEALWISENVQENMYMSVEPHVNIQCVSVFQIRKCWFIWRNWLKKNDYIYWGMHYFDSLLEIWRRLSSFIFSLSTAFVIENFCWKHAGLLDTQLWWGCMDSLRSLNTEFSKLHFFFL